MLPSVGNREGDGAAVESSRVRDDLTLSNTPRHVVIRSRVLMQRTAAGPRGISLPKELWPVSGKVQSVGNANGTSNTGWNRATHFVGEGPQLVPVELVAATSPRKQTARLGSAHAGGVKGEKGAEDHVGASSSRHFVPPPLTPDLRAELKQRLDGMSRADCKVNPKNASFFLREFWKVYQLLKLPVHPRAYRKGVLDALQTFVQLLPEQLQVDMAQLKAELREGSFLAMTVMIALGNLPWTFNFNMTTHCICNCPGGGGCFFPINGVRASDYQTYNWNDLARWSKRPGPVAKLAGAEVAGPSPTAASAASVQGHKEKHFPRTLSTCMEALKARFLEFSGQVGTFLEDLLTIPEQQGELHSHGQQAWVRWASHVVSEINVMDRYYTGFEQLYMGLVQKLIETTLEPVRAMARPSETILRGEGPFTEMAHSVVCQQLGLLKKQVDFEGRHQLTVFDPGLLQKARRVLQMETYVEVQDMARNLLRTFDRLCQVLSHLDTDHIKPHLSENAVLKQAVVALEEAWAECQYLLHQGSLDFMKEMMEIMPRLSARLKWQMKIAMGGVDGKVSEEEEDLPAARVTLYQTVPMVIYVDELWRDVGPQATAPVTSSSGRAMRAPSETAAAQERQKPGQVPRFQELFCPQDDRHHTLRRDFGKFDEQRYQRFRNFLTGDGQEGDDDGQRDFFLLVYKQLKAFAGFPVQDSVTDAITAASASSQAVNSKTQNLSNRDAAEAQRTHELLEGAARWVTLVTQVQAVAPHLFPSKNPVMKRESLQGMQRRGSVMGRRASLAKDPQLTTVLPDT
mmetsp:Transcript_902/g.1760  ORF Transcript_902/g.1760 Transcript_902/m.1760 type:complete len:798 (-) Transcript_902:85-2478(-)